MAGRAQGRFTQHRKLDHLRRLLEHNPKGMTLYELATALDVSPRSARRYLAEMGRRVPLISERERAGGPMIWRLSGSAIPRKVALRRVQAFSLLAARHVFDILQGSSLFEEIDMAMQRLVGIARRPGRGPNAGINGPRLEERFLYLPTTQRDFSERAEEVDNLFQAVADLRPLHCQFVSRVHGTSAPLVIHPYAMVLYGGDIYCVGRDVASDSVRTYPVSAMRLSRLDPTTRFELPSNFRVERHFRGQFSLGGDREHRVVVDFDERTAEILKRFEIHPSQRLEATQDGGLRLTLYVSDLEEFSSWVMSYGDAAVVREPPELRESIRDRLERTLRHYGAETPAPDAAHQPGEAKSP